MSAHTLTLSLLQGPMLRAMLQALKKHAEEHPNDPFDHERHMPECMKAARVADETWAGSSGGAGSSSGADGHQVPTLRTLTLTLTLVLTLTPNPIQVSDTP